MNYHAGQKVWARVDDEAEASMILKYGYGELRAVVAGNEFATRGSGFYTIDIEDEPAIKVCFAFATKLRPRRDDDNINDKSDWSQSVWIPNGVIS